MMKWLLLFLMCSAQYCFCQENQTVISVTSINQIEGYILKKYKPGVAFMDTTCLNAVILVKFRIHDKHVDSLEFSDTIPLQIRRAIGEVLLPEQGGLVFSDGGLYANRIIVIPMMFSYSAGCSVPVKVETDANGQILNAKRLQNKSFSASFRNIMQFESGNKASLDCLLLPPMYFSAIY